MISIKPYNGFPLSVYVDGVPLRKQLLEGLTFINGEIHVWCYTDKRMKDVETPSEVKYVKSFETIPATIDCAEKTLFIFKK